MEACERYAYYGLRAVLGLYLKNSLGYSPDDATAIALYASALAYFTPLLGGYISDSAWGKYKTIIVFGIIYCVGSATLATTSIFELVWGAYLGLIFIGFGTGGIKPCVSSFGADQFAKPELSQNKSKKELEDEIGIYFHTFYFAINLGSLGSYIFTPLLRSHVGFFAAFGVPAIFLCIALVVFFSGRNNYLKIPSKGSILLPLVRALWYGFRHRKEASQSAEPIHWIETSLGHNGVTKRDVANARAFWRVLPLFTLMPAFWMLLDQQSNAWTFQAERMQLNGLEPEQMNVINPICIVILIPLFEKWLYPALDRCGLNFGVFKRIGCGMILSIIAFLLSALVQHQVDTSEPNSVNVFWQIPQFVIISCAEIFISVTGLEFAYTQAPSSLKSLLSAFWLVTVGTGDLLAGALYNGLSGPLADQVNRYIFFSGLMFIDFLIFLIVAYTYQAVPSQIGEIDEEDETLPTAKEGETLPTPKDGDISSQEAHSVGHIRGIEA